MARCDLEKKRDSPSKKTAGRHDFRDQGDVVDKLYKRS